MIEQLYERAALPDGSKRYYSLVEGTRTGLPHRTASAAIAAQPALLDAYQAELRAKGDAILAGLAQEGQTYNAIKAEASRRMELVPNG